MLITEISKSWLLGWILGGCIFLCSQNYQTKISLGAGQWVLQVWSMAVMQEAQWSSDKSLSQEHWFQPPHCPLCSQRPLAESGSHAGPFRTSWVPLFWYLHAQMLEFPPIWVPGALAAPLPSTLPETAGSQGWVLSPRIFCLCLTGPLYQCSQPPLIATNQSGVAGGGQARKSFHWGVLEWHVFSLVVSTPHSFSL